MRSMGTLAMLMCLSVAGLARAQALPLDTAPQPLRSQLRYVMDSPSLSVSGKPETFQAEPDVYRWLLENPTVAITLWRQLGAQVTGVQEVPQGRYNWTDGKGSDVVWFTALKSPTLQVWYVEGKVKPALLLPASAFKAVCVLVYNEGKDDKGRPTIRHQAHFHVRCDGRAMALAARVLGGSAPRLGEQYLGQMQLFYGGMSWYLCQDRARARRMLVKAGLLAPTAKE